MISAVEPRGRHKCTIARISQEAEHLNPVNALKIYISRISRSYPPPGQWTSAEKMLGNHRKSRILLSGFPSENVNLKLAFIPLPTSNVTRLYYWMGKKKTRTITLYTFSLPKTAENGRKFNSNATNSFPKGLSHFPVHTLYPLTYDYIKLSAKYFVRPRNSRTMYFTCLYFPMTSLRTSSNTLLQPLPAYRIQDMGDLLYNNSRTIFIHEKFSRLRFIRCCRHFSGLGFHSLAKTTQWRQQRETKWKFY